MLSEAIRKSMEFHLSMGGLIFGQNLTDVGWVANTLPPFENHPGYIELPITDIAGPGISVGAALSGKPSIYICRYQGFLWLNIMPFATYAASCRRVFDQDCPVMIRAIADDGSFGPISGGSHFSLALQTSELKVVAPVIDTDWDNIWTNFASSKDPI